MRGKFKISARTDLILIGFNEARALCAGSSAKVCAAPPGVPCFNEARALCAGSSGR